MSGMSNCSENVSVISRGTPLAKLRARFLEIPSQRRGRAWRELHVGIDENQNRSSSSRGQLGAGEIFSAPARGQWLSVEETKPRRFAGDLLNDSGRVVARSVVEHDDFIRAARERGTHRHFDLSGFVARRDEDGDRFARTLARGRRAVGQQVHEK